MFVKSESSNPYFEVEKESTKILKGNGNPMQ